MAAMGPSLFNMRTPQDSGYYLIRGAFSEEDVEHAREQKNPDFRRLILLHSDLRGRFRGLDAV